MKKKRAIRRFVVLAILLLVCFIFSFVSFRIPTTVNNFAGFVNGIYKGIDLNGGITATFDVEYSKDFDGGMSTAVDKACSRVENLLKDEYTEYYVEKVDDDKIRITIPKLDDSTTIKTNDLVNYITFTTSEVTEPEKFEATFTGANITSAKYFTSNGAFGTLIEFDEAGKEALLEMAKTVSSEGTLFIYQDKDYSSILLRISINQEALTSIAEAKQLFVSDVSLFPTKADAQNFADKILSGTLNIDMALNGEILEVSPSMGEGFATFTLLAIIVLIVLSIVYLVIKYKQLAIATILSMLSFIAISVVIMPLMTGVQMSLVGLIAFIEAYIVAFMGHIIYLEKSKNEFANGKKLLASFKSAYSKSVITITDIYVTIMLVSIATILVGAGAIKTMATIIALLLLPAMLTSALIHRGLVKWYLDINPTKYKKMNFTKGVTENE